MLNIETGNAVQLNVQPAESATRRSDPSETRAAANPHNELAQHRSNAFRTARAHGRRRLLRQPCIPGAIGWNPGASSTPADIAPPQATTTFFVPSESYRPDRFAERPPSFCRVHSV